MSGLPVEAPPRLPAVQVEPVAEPLAGLALRPWSVSLLRMVSLDGTS